MRRAWAIGVMLPSLALADASLPRTGGNAGGAVAGWTPACGKLLERSRQVAASQDRIFERAKIEIAHDLGVHLIDGEVVLTAALFTLPSRAIAADSPWAIDIDQTRKDGGRYFHTQRVRKGKMAYLRAVGVSASTLSTLVKSFQPALDACLEMDGIP